MRMFLRTSVFDNTSFALFLQVVFIAESALLKVFLRDRVLELLHQDFLLIFQSLYYVFIILLLFNLLVSLLVIAVLDLS